MSPTDVVAAELATRLGQVEDVVGRPTRSSVVSIHREAVCSGPSTSSRTVDATSSRHITEAWGPVATGAPISPQRRVGLLDQRRPRRDDVVDGGMPIW